ncbi:MAG: hypothetical protein FWH14_05835 [Oscillospiraceae bacterium]|nr:hypothetical protein [Oscillospiraceae bacterium]
MEIIVCKPLFPSGEGCRRSGGVVCRNDRPRSSVVIARAGVFPFSCLLCFSWLPPVMNLHSAFLILH